MSLAHAGARQIAQIDEALGGAFIGYAVRIYLSYTDALAQKTFRYSILYLAALFAALLVDHYL